MNKAVKIKADGHLFDNLMKYKRWCQLKILASSNKITDLSVRPRLSINIDGKKVFTALGDFEYIEKSQWIVEDVKKRDTPIGRLKRKMVNAQYPSINWRVLMSV